MAEGMSEVHLEPEEVAYIEQFKDPIDTQLGLIDHSIDAGTADYTAWLVAELCIYHFTLGREFEKNANSSTT